jgi:pantothenate kinase type III
MEAGIFLAVTGGIREAVYALEKAAKVRPQIFLTGGDAALLARERSAERPDDPLAHAVLWPTQTLDGILRSVEGRP